MNYKKLPAIVVHYSEFYKCPGLRKRLKQLSTIINQADRKNEFRKVGFIRCSCNYKVLYQNFCYLDEFSIQ